MSRSFLIRFPRLVLLTLLAVFTAACASTPPAIQVSTDETADWSRYSTVQLDDASPMEGPVLEALKRAVASELQAKGYRMVDQAADATFRYRVVITQDERVNQEVIPTAAGNVMRVTTESINEGRILANFVDNRTGKVVWKAAAQRRLSDSAEPISNEELNQRVQRFLTSLPISGSQPQ